MLIIYDFDGTLTPYALPHYEILKKCGYDDKKLVDKVTKEIKENKTEGLYDAFYKCYKDIYAENNIEMTEDNVLLGVDTVEFNEGVEEYFRKFQSSNTGAKHYIITSGIRDYVEKTRIGKFINEIYGVTFKKENGIFKDLDILVTDQDKVKIIKKIQKENDETNQIIYFGDGLTDMEAFEYVHNIGGESVFIATDEQSMINYQKINANGIIDKCFKADFRLDSEISEYIQEKIDKK